MKVFIAGATGVLGRRVVQLLVAHGHNVMGLSRSPKNVEWLTQHGAEPRLGDLFNREQICQLSADCDVFLHLATAIPTKSRSTLADWATNDHIRRAGTQVMIEAALRNQAALYLQQSVTFLYGNRQGEWVDESSPMAANPGSLLQSAADMERFVQEAVQQRGLPALILRFGTFYSYDSAQTRDMFELTRKGFFPLIGDGKAYCNPINVEDAANAVLMAVQNPPAGIGQTFNVCDDQPVTYRELLTYLAQTLAARKPIGIPPILAKLLLGSHVVDFLLASVRCKNRLIKEKLGWKPYYPTYQAGYQAEIKKWLSL